MSLTPKDKSEMKTIMMDVVIDALNEVVLPKLEEHQTQIVEIKETMSDIYGTLDSMNRKLDSHTDRLDRHDQKLKKHDEKLLKLRA